MRAQVLRNDGWLGATAFHKPWDAISVATLDARVQPDLSSAQMTTNRKSPDNFLQRLFNSRCIQDTYQHGRSQGGYCQTCWSPLSDVLIGSRRRDITQP